jgi:exosortase A
MSRTESFRDGPPISSDGGLSRDWRFTLVAVGIVVIFLLVLFRDTGSSIVNIWSTNSAYGHGFLIVPIVAWLIWKRRPTIAAIRPRPWLWGVPIFLGFVLVWLAAEIISVQVVAQFAFIAIIEAACLSLLGPRVFKAALFPAAFLFLTVPFGDGVTPDLQLWTADIAVWALDMSGVPVWQDALWIVTPTGNFVIANECAGLRFFMATTALAVLVAAEFYRSWWRRLGFFAFALVLPVVANGLRAYTVILLAGWLGIGFAASVDHVVYGWIFFMLVTLVLLGVGAWFRQAPVDWMPVRSLEPAVSSSPVVSIIGIAVILAGSASTLAVGYDRAGRFSPAHPADTLVLESDGPAVARPGPDWAPSLPGADIRHVSTVAVDGRPVTRAVGYYFMQRQGAKAALDEWLLAGQKWERASIDHAAVMVGGQTIDAVRLVVAQDGQQRLILAWDWIDGRFTGSDTMGKLYEIRGLLHGHTAAATIVVSTTLRPGESVSSAQNILQSFLATQPHLAADLARVRQSISSSSETAKPF